MYLPTPRLERDTDGVYRASVNAVGWGTPNQHPADGLSFSDLINAPGLQRYPAEDATIIGASISQWYTGTTRFLPYFISYVDSPDGGLTFPIYAPTMRPSRDASGAVTAWATDADTWSAAGWTATSIPSITDPANAAVIPLDGLYIVYRDPRVFDLADEYDAAYTAVMSVVPANVTDGIGRYLMTCLEHTHPTPAYSDDDPLLGIYLTPAERDAATACDVAADCQPGSRRCSLAFTRIVLFASNSPDFAATDTWPVAGVTAQAVVLFQPEDTFLPNNETPTTSGCSASLATSETFGVPEAVVSPDRTTLILYVPWNTFGTTVDVLPTSIPTRVLDRYGPYGPVWTRSGATTAGKTGMSVFTFDLQALLGLLIDLAIGLSYDDSVSAGIAALRVYQGEVLTWDGTVPQIPRPPPDLALSRPNHVAAVDPNFNFHAGRLWQWLNRATAIQDTGSQATNPHTLTRAYNLCVSDLLAMNPEIASIGSATDPQLDETQGPYTLFVLPSSCSDVLNMREVVYSTDELASAPDQGLIRDQDIVDLGLGVVRAAFFCAPNVNGTDTTQINPGLVQAIYTTADPTDREALADLLIPR